jgi:hypothetical protein
VAHADQSEADRRQQIADFAGMLERYNAADGD